MNKTDLLDRFARDGESRLLLARILDQQQRAQQRSIPTHTGFLSPAQQAESADLLENARYHRDCIRRLMEKLREVADRMEKFVAASEWPIPTYADLLYRV